VTEIGRAGDRAASLTRQLLAFSRRQMLEMRVLDLNEVLDGMGKMLRRVIGEHILLHLDLEPHIGHVKADPGQVEQVVLNLAVNARDAMPDGGQLTIATAAVELDAAYAAQHPDAAPGPYVRLSIHDTGQGMTAEVKEHLFEPFFTTKGLGKGTGLGLATVYGIVKQCGGSIYVYSEPYLGTTFKIYFPRLVEEGAARVAAAADPAMPHGTETVLLVEDGEDVRALTERMLRYLGYRVFAAESGAAVLRLMTSFAEPLHLVLTDVVMPGMSGRDLVERLLGLRRDFKVLYMSGYTDDAIVQHGVLDPGIQFIQKPFTLEALAHKLRTALQKG
jgi:two-component system cell cycle sensor histidine kinase/response regulator CckA